MLPEAQVPAAIAFLSELDDEEVIDAETSAKLDAALTEPGENVSLDDLIGRRKIL